MGLVGIDIIEISRIAGALERFGDRFLNKVYTPEEIAHCGGNVSSLAARFAAKEAVMKALGTGRVGVTWKEIAVLPDPRGKPVVTLFRRAQERAKELKVKSLDISLSHSKEYAVASVMAETYEADNSQ